MNSNFTKSVMALAAIAHQVHSTPLHCPQERPIHSFITDAQATNNDSTYLESYVTDAGDGYELVLYRISRKCNASVPIPSDKGPMLLIHGTTDDASQWMDKPEDGGDSIGMQYARDGYDVWYANMRGSGPSSPPQIADGEIEGEDAPEDDYWEFDYNHHAEEDLPAMIEKVIEVNGDCKKVTLVGHSLGGTILANGLSKSEHARNYVAQAIGIAPCFLASTGYFGDLEALSLIETYQALNMFIELYQVKSLFGADWPTHVAAICSLGESSATAAMVCEALNEDNLSLYS